MGFCWKEITSLEISLRSESMRWESSSNSFCHFLSPEEQFNRSFVLPHVFWFSEDIYVYTLIEETAFCGIAFRFRSYRM